MLLREFSGNRGPQGQGRAWTETQERGTAGLGPIGQPALGSWSPQFLRHQEKDRAGKGSLWGSRYGTGWASANRVSQRGDSKTVRRQWLHRAEDPQALGRQERLLAPFIPFLSTPVSHVPPPRKESEGSSPIQQKQKLREERKSQQGKRIQELAHVPGSHLPWARSGSVAFPMKQEVDKG